ncbi:carbon monoxide dehydrogenase subunit G [Pseudonocardia sp. NPDC046786]|uniref:SRPBCC family protein n=1 Tax=Pseudonocardia sp. NPDC046786 TaxID=3155471 RepID=UPI0033DB353A
MKISGTDVVPHPVEHVWAALLDPRVLVTTIPGCEKLEATGENAYAMTVTAGVAAIKGTYAGSCALSDLKEHESLVMTLRGSGGPGTVDAVVDVGFDDLGDGRTRISYAADATVGGMVGGVGQRMLASVSKRMAAEFFGNVGRAIAAPPGAVPSGAASGAVPSGAASGAVLPGAALVGDPGSTAPAGVFTAPPASGDFTRGVGVGAAVALLGVLVGAAIGRRR